MLTLYFSGTGNTKFIAELFSSKMGAVCFSIEEPRNFTSLLKAHDTVCFCYPIYGSRVPRILREFVARHMSDINGKKIVILVTQVLFSGDGARVFTDMFWDGAIDVIYAEHFLMPSNVCNLPLLWQTSQRKTQRYIARAKVKMHRVCQNIKSGTVVKRGFTVFSQVLGNIQGRLWQGSSKEIYPARFSAENMAMAGVKIHKQCHKCGKCISACPVKNFENTRGAITHKSSCIVCYRCVNLCPKRAITVMMFHRRPRRQYTAMIKAHNEPNKN